MRTVMTSARAGVGWPDLQHSIGQILPQEPGHKELLSGRRSAKSVPPASCDSSDTHQLQTDMSAMFDNVQNGEYTEIAF